MNVSVVVCAKNEERYIENCLKCLKNQTIKPEIIVVDGHSKDRTVSIAKKYADRIVRDNKTGLAYARNFGCKIARGDIVAYCDADCLPTRDWVERISRIMGDNICLSGPLYPYDGNMLMKVHFKVWTNLVTRFFCLLGLKYIWGPNMVFKKDTIEKYPFRVNFLEDYELVKRIRRIGKIRFSKELLMPVSIRHLRYGFYFSVLRFYATSFFRIKLKRKLKYEGYWNS